MKKLISRFGSLSVLALVLLTGCQQYAKGPQRKVDRTIRAIWVTRWDYKSEEDIIRVMDACKSSGFNTVLFQVRGNGTVSYPSRIEPWSKEFNYRHPGFDPLRFACDAAHERDMSLHAWVNVMPGWRGKNPPVDPNQLYNAKPHWFWQDASGRRQPLGWYNSVNPCYPEVRKYLCDIMGEIVSNYEVDGVHLDYIRFPNEWNSSYPDGAKVPDYPRDARTLSMFRKATGHTPESSPKVWDSWRTGQVTQLVRDIRTTVKRIDSNVKLSAAVGRDPALSRNSYFQDSHKWLRENLLDAVYPMNYERDVNGFEKYVSTWAHLRPPIPVVMGIMFDQAPGHIVNQQIERTMRTGAHFAAFAYNAMFDRTDTSGRPVRDKQSAQRDSLRRAVVPTIREQQSRASRKLATR